MDRRRNDRRCDHAFMGERGMRCQGCGRVWFSAVSALVVERFSCIACEGRMHTDRRVVERRAPAAVSPAARRP